MVRPPAPRLDTAAPAAANALEGLTKYYGSVRGVEELQPVVSPGEVFGFRGPNGAGKTTTIRLLMGFLKPTRGHGFVFGQDIGKDSTCIRRDVGFLPGLVTPYEHMTGSEVWQAITTVPEFVWELSLGIYLIVKGFKPSPIIAE